MGSSEWGGGNNGDAAAEVEDGDREPLGSDALNTGPFFVGEKVLSDNVTVIYDAKVQKAEFKDGEWKYYLHYLGWNKTWDEWVGSDRLMKYTEENLLKKMELTKKFGSDKNSKSYRSMQNKPRSSTVARGKKRKGQSDVEEKETRLPEKSFALQFPSTLKKQLVDDCEFVTQLGKLVRLPRSPNVDEILTKYHDYRTKKDGTIPESLGEILNGIRAYFDKALQPMLLYKKEREQYRDSVTSNVSPSTIYGAEHLLRLFVKLPELLANINMEEEALAKLQQKLLDILKFLQKNQTSFFLPTYDDGADRECP